mgnify:CR=1 FL=1
MIINIMYIIKITEMTNSIQNKPYLLSSTHLSALDDGYSVPKDSRNSIENFVKEKGGIG